MSIPNCENVELEVQNPNTSNLDNMEAKNKNSSSNHLMNIDILVNNEI